VVLIKITPGESFALGSSPRRIKSVNEFNDNPSDLGERDELKARVATHATEIDAASRESLSNVNRRFVSQHPLRLSSDTIRSPTLKRVEYCLPDWVAFLAAESLALLSRTYIRRVS